MPSTNSLQWPVILTLAMLWLQGTATALIPCSPLNPLRETVGKNAKCGEGGQLLTPLSRKKPDQWVHETGRDASAGAVFGHMTQLWVCFGSNRVNCSL